MHLGVLGGVPVDQPLVFEPGHLRRWLTTDLAYQPHPLALDARHVRCDEVDRWPGT